MTTEQLFQRLLSFVLRPDHEGDYSDRPEDAGGKTKRGITEAVARAWGWTGDMRDLPMDLTEQIYRKDYFEASKCAQLPPSVAALVFDGAVMGGGRQSLQSALNRMALGLNLKVDGDIGEKTLGALRRVTPERVSELVDLVAAERAKWFAEAKDRRTGDRLAPKNPGWFARLMRCHRLAIELTKEKA